MICDHVRVAVGFALAVAACSSDGKPSSVDAAAGKSVDAGTRDAAPVFHDAPAGSQLALVVPIAGPPSFVFVTDMMPAPVAGQTLHLQLDASSANGDLYVVAVLYQTGGGQFSPKSGVDYVAQSAMKFHFTGAPIDLGTLDLALAP